jgi:DNA-binding NtrC family response regulator
MKGAPRVIVVDDDEDIGLVLRVVLRLDGFEVWRTISAEECLAKLKELEGKVDVIIINGSIVSDRSASLILKIERINSEIKTLVIAERYHAEVKTRIMDYGADEFALKPLTMDSVANKVSILLAEQVGPARL